MFLNNPIISEEFCFTVYAKNKEEAIEKVKGFIKSNTNVNPEEKRFIEFSFDNTEYETHREIQKYVKHLLTTKQELSSNDYPIGFFRTDIREILRSEIVGAEVKRAEVEPAKFVTAYHVKTYPGEIKNPLNEYCNTKREALQLAKKHAERYDTEVIINKTMILTNGDNQFPVATVTAKKTHQYGKEVRYYFFGVDEVNRKRRMY